MKKKLISYILILAVALMGFGLDAAAASTKSVKKPVIKLSSPSANTLVVKTTSAAKHQGFQIRYSRSSSFKSYTSVKVKTSKALNKKFSSLTGDRIYYVKVRSYQGKKYSPWSKVKSCSVKEAFASTSKSYGNVYVNAWKLNLEDTKNSTKKWDTNPEVYTIAYLTPVKVFGDIGPYKKKQWVKLEYAGRTFYTYVDPAKDAEPFTSKKPDYDYQKYCTSPLQEAIVERALMIYENGIIESYDNGHKTYRISMGDDFNKADCVNFVRFIMNPILGSDFVPVKPELVWENGTKVSKEELVPGDIICTHETNKNKVVDHVGVYLGGGDFIQCTGPIPGSRDGGVLISPLKGKYVNCYVGAVRYIQE